jgi:hypothetical protein
LKSGEASARNVISSPIYEKFIEIKISEKKEKEPIKSKRRSTYSNLLGSVSKES